MHNHSQEIRLKYLIVFFNLITRFARKLNKELDKTKFLWYNIYIQNAFSFFVPFLFPPYPRGGTNIGGLSLKGCWLYEEESKMPPLWEMAIYYGCE